MGLDLTAFHWLNDLGLHHDGLEDFAGAYATASQYLFAGVVVILLIGLGLRPAVDMRRAGVASLVSAAASLLVAHLLGIVVNRPRPFIAHPATTHLFVAHAADPSFPSEHATAAFAIAVSVWLLFRVPGALLILAAVALSVSRVIIGIHYPSDVLAGAAIGTGVALIVGTPQVRAVLDRLPLGGDESGGVRSGSVGGVD